MIYQWYCASSFFVFLFFFLHLVLFLHLVKVCIVVLIVFSVCTFCTNGDNNNYYYYKQNNDKILETVQDTQFQWKANRQADKEI